MMNTNSKKTARKPIQLNEQYHGIVREIAELYGMRPGAAARLIIDTGAPILRATAPRTKRQPPEQA